MFVKQKWNRLLRLTYLPISDENQKKKNYNVAYF